MEAHAGDYPVATPLVAIAPKVPVEGQTVTYGSDNGQSFKGYLARPQEATGPLPALIVIHEWWGLNDNIKAMTKSRTKATNNRRPDHKQYHGLVKFIVVDI